MKPLFLGLVLLLTGNAVAGVTDLIMPVSEHAELSNMQINLVIDDLDDPPPAVSGFVAEMLKEAGVVAAVNATYTVGDDPPEMQLIDLNVHRYATADEARESIVSSLEGLEMTAGIGDAAGAINSLIFVFSVANARVYMTASGEGIDVESVAKSYAAWLAGVAEN